ncbi:MAG: HIG1 domain-containing protein [Kordiimonadaceae bacterium]|nr:HIG1 domain-containing protein [Kordiimonadaceae bacterium]
MTTLLILAGLSAFATFVVLLMGIMTLGKKGPENRGRANKMMRFRILFQSSTLVFLVLAAVAS